MRWKEIREASIPFGKNVTTEGITFGFEAEFLILPSHYVDEVDIYDIDEDHFCNELDCDEDKFEHEFNLWKRNNDEDGSVHEWIEDIGEENWWKLVDAGSHSYSRYALVDGYIHRYNDWYEAMNHLAEDIIGVDDHNVIISSNDDEVITDKNYNNWYIEGDISVKGDDESHYGFEIVSPIFNNFDDFVTAMENIFNRVASIGSIYSNNTTGLHINIGAKSKNIDPLKLLVFSGENWMINDWDRKGNPNTMSLLQQISPLPSSIQDAQEVVDAFINQTTDKHWITNIRTLKERGYLEFRASGGRGYEKKIDKINNYINRYIQLIGIASNPDKYKTEYMKKISSLKNDYEENNIPIESRIIKQWLDNSNYRESDKKKVFDNGSIVINAEYLIRILGFSNNIDPKVKRILVRNVGKDSIDKEIKKYSEHIPYGITPTTINKALELINKTIGSRYRLG